MRSISFFGFILMFLLLFFMPAGLFIVMLGGARGNAARSSSTNNLKQIGLAFQTYNDVNNCLPHNGGHTDPDKLKGINYGWHNPNFRDSGTWATQILPFLEQDALFRNNVIVSEAADKVPAWFTAAGNNHFWQVTVKNLVCPGRGRNGWKSNTAAGNYPGIVTDYAINTFVNSPPTDYSKHGFALSGGVPIAAQSKMTVQGIQDGSSNTILAGGKALPPSIAANNDAAKWDEGIFSPGNYKADNEKSTLTSTGTGRGHVIAAEPPEKNVTERPEKGGVPWMWTDEQLRVEKDKKVPEYAMDWGGPFPTGVLFMFGDGSVRMMKLKQRGTVNFARMLYPSDGQVVQFD